MKKHLLFFRTNGTLLLILFLVMSCNRDEIGIQDEDNSGYSDEIGYEYIEPVLVSDKDILRAIASAGFETNDVHETENYYIVEGDIAISKENVNVLSLTGQTAVSSNLAMNYSNTANIKYFIHSSVASMSSGTDWISAIRSAVVSWNNINNCSIAFQEVFSSGSAELIIYADNSSAAPSSHRNLASSIWARATFPENGNIGSVLSINDVSPGTPNQNGRITIIEHELGHCLGFHHSSVGNTSTTKVICGTNLNDSSSIMHTPYNGTSTRDINQDDIKAARFLYPYPTYGTSFPDLTVSSGRWDRRRGVKALHVKMNNDYNRDWNKMIIQYGGSGIVTDCAPSEGTTFHRQLGSNFRSVQIRFENHKGDVTSSSVTFSNL